MAIYDNLPVFKQTYDLLLLTVRLSSNLQRDFRYTIGEELKREIIALCVGIYKANLEHEKRTFIADAREKLVVVKLLIRILHDCKQIPIKQFGMFIEHTESISKQLVAWDKYIRKMSTEGDKPPSEAHQQ